MAKSIYRKLTGRKGAIFGYSQLWLAPDHILLLKSTHLAEQYQRFALADIQAITITESAGRTPYQIAAAAVAIAWSLGFVAVRSPFTKYFFLITGAVALAAVIVDLLRGPHCRCDLTTAVSRERLRPVSRLRTARSFLAIVEPAIEAVQGSLGSPGRIEVSQSAPRLDQPPEVPAVSSLLPEIVFGLFLLDAALILLALRFPRSQIDAVLPTTFFAEIVLVMVALIRRAGRDPRHVIYALLLLAMVGIGWDAVGMGRNLRAMINIAIETGSQSKALEAWTQTPLQRSAVLSAVWRIVAGTGGLAAVFLARTSK
ncbi:MAG TPA: hypothetical protein VK419_12835 [Bryobacteraceae bacterium]|nr:hypothetical protein [Bryobacteraceae bacterium]